MGTVPMGINQAPESRHMRDTREPGHDELIELLRNSLWDIIGVTRGNQIGTE